MELLLGISIWVGGLFVMLLLSGWVLSPLERRAKDGPYRMQFSLGDWICLILMIQLWAAGVHSFIAVVGPDGGSALVMDVYGWILVVLLWLGVVQRLSAAGIRQSMAPRRRSRCDLPAERSGRDHRPKPDSGYCDQPTGTPEHCPPPTVPLACAVALALLLGAMVASAHFVKKIVAALDVESVEKEVVGCMPASGEHSQCDEAADPENGQDDRK